MKIDFPDKAMPILDASKRKLLANQQWEPARALLRQARYDKQVRELLDDKQLKRIDAWLKDIDIFQDQNLYDQVCRTKTADAIEAYLNTAPRKTMVRPVTGYKDYTKAMGEQLKLKLILKRIEWPSNCWNASGGGSSNTVTVTVDGNAIIDVTHVASKRSGSVADVGEGELFRKLTDSVTVHVKITHDGHLWGNNWLGHTINGEGGENILVGKLAGKAITLNDVDIKPAVTFILEGIPQEPALPSWRND